MSNLGSAITKNGAFVFVIVMFALVIISGIDAMASFEAVMLSGITDSFGFMPVIILIGTLGFLTGRGR